MRNKIKKIIEWQNNILETFINDSLNNAIPKIKGKTTKGKLKWRGIKLCSVIKSYPNKYWLTQRGKKISKYLFIDFIKKDNEFYHKAFLR